MELKTKKKIVVIGSAVLMAVGWILGGLFVANSVLGFMDGIKDDIAAAGAAGVVSFAAIFVVVNTLLFFVSGLGSAFIYSANLLFPLWTAFVVSVLCIFLSSILVYLLGRWFGVKAFKWAFTDEEMKKANEIIGSPTFIALALLLPAFPDTLVCFLAGASRMKMFWFSLIALITRSIGVAGICFMGSGVLSIETWTPVFEAVGTIPALLLMFSTLVSFATLIIALFFAGKYVERKVKAAAIRRQESQHKEIIF